MSNTIKIGTDPHTGDEVWAEVTRVCDPNRRLGYRLTYFGRKHDMVLDTEGRWIDRQEATRANSVWRNLNDAETAAVLTIHR